MSQEKYLKSIDHSLKVIASELSKVNQRHPEQAKGSKAYKGMPDSKIYKGMPPDRRETK